LRPQSDFFPKANFWHAAASLPHGARAVALFGEIDCREALLICVERKRYESVEEGAAAVIDVYVSALLELAERRKLAKLWVHAVPPVLNETRRVVRLFNRILRQKVLAASGASSPLVWLEGMEETMLDGAGDEAGLNPELKLDGTHMHPRCAGLLEAALLRSGWEPMASS